MEFNYLCVVFIMDRLFAKRLLCNFENFLEEILVTKFHGRALIYCEETGTVIW